MGKFLVIIFLNTVLCKVYFADDGACSRRVTASSCADQGLLPLSTVRTSVCTWNSSQEFCFFNPKTVTLADIIMLAALVVICSTPVVMFYSHLTFGFVSYMTFKVVKKRSVEDLYDVQGTDMQQQQESTSIELKNKASRGGRAVVSDEGGETKHTHEDEDEGASRRALDRENGVVRSRHESTSHEIFAHTAEQKSPNVKYKMTPLVPNALVDVYEGPHVTLEGLVRAQSQQNKLMLAARLVKMQLLMDFATTEMEAQTLIKQCELGGSFRLLSANRGNVFNEFGFLGKMERAFYNFLVWCGAYGIPSDPEFASLAIHYDLSCLRTTVTKRALMRARRLTSIVANHLEMYSAVKPKSAFLIREFAVQSVPLLYQDHIRNLMTMTNQSPKTRFTKVQNLLKALAFLIITAGLFAGTVLISFKIGNDALASWTSVSLAAALGEVFLLEPCRQCVDFLLVTLVVSDRLVRLRKLLIDRSKLLLSRWHGLMHYHDCLRQHFNPACRVARTFPELAVSRLLMVLNDADLPVLTPRPGSILYWKMLIGATVELTGAPFLIFPYYVRCLLFDCILTFVVSVILANIAAFASALLPVILISFYGAIAVLLLSGFIVSRTKDTAAVQRSAESSKYLASMSDILAETCNVAVLMKPTSNAIPEPSADTFDRTDALKNGFKKWTTGQHDRIAPNYRENNKLGALSSRIVSIEAGMESSIFLDGLDGALVIDSSNGNKPLGRHFSLLPAPAPFSTASERAGQSADRSKKSLAGSAILDPAALGQGQALQPAVPAIADEQELTLLRLRLLELELTDEDQRERERLVELELEKSRRNRRKRRSVKSRRQYDRDDDRREYHRDGPTDEGLRSEPRTHHMRTRHKPKGSKHGRASVGRTVEGSQAITDERGGPTGGDDAGDVHSQPSIASDSDWFDWFPGSDVEGHADGDPLHERKRRGAGRVKPKKVGVGLGRGGNSVATDRQRENMQERGQERGEERVGRDRTNRQRHAAVLEDDEIGGSLDNSQTQTSPIRDSAGMQLIGRGGTFLSAPISSNSSTHRTVCSVVGQPSVNSLYDDSSTVSSSVRFVPGAYLDDDSVVAIGSVSRRAKHFESNDENS